MSEKRTNTQSSSNIHGQKTDHNKTDHEIFSLAFSSFLSDDSDHKAGEMSPVPVEAVNHFEVHPQVLLGEVVQHAGIHQALHEVAAVLR